MSDVSKIDRKVAEILKHTCDVSMRDGMQCLYNNTWEIQDLLLIAKKLNEVAHLVKEITGETLTVEAAGGDSFNAAMRLKGEDPFENGRKFKEAMPDCRLRCLTRGRQLLAFTPVSDEVIAKAVQESAENGIGQFRVIDMLNKVDNLAPSIKAVLEYRNSQLDRAVPTDKALALELGICYISEPQDGITVVSIDDYVRMGQEFIREANKYMRKGDPAVDINMKDYAGLLTPETSTAIAKGLRRAFEKMYDDGELSYIPKIVVHSHGDKAEQLKQTLEAGADYVDTAIGKLSGGTSHTNVFDFLRAQGITQAEIDEGESALLNKLREAEQLIDTLSKKYVSYKTATVPIKDVYESRIAGGAVAAVQHTLKGQRKNLEICWERNGISKDKFPSDHEAFQEVLKVLPEIWNRSGRTSTATPGSKIFSDMAILAVMHSRKAGADGAVIQDIFPPYKSITPAYKNLVMGRFGDNSAAINKVGDPQVLLLRKAFLIEDTLKALPSSGLDAVALEEIGAGKIIGRSDNAIPNNDLYTLDYVKLAEEGVLESLTKKIDNASVTHPSPQMEQLKLHCKIGKLPDEPMMWEKCIEYAKGLHETGIISEEQINRTALLKAMSDPNKPSQVEHMYERQKTGKPPKGSTILDLRGYVANLNGVQFMVPDGDSRRLRKVKSLGELASMLAPIERWSVPTSGDNDDNTRLARYKQFATRAQQEAEQSLRSAGFSEELNGTAMGIDTGMQIFRELVDDAKLSRQSSPNVVTGR